MPKLGLIEGEISKSSAQEKAMDYWGGLEDKENWVPWVSPVPGHPYRYWWGVDLTERAPLPHTRSPH